MTTSRRTNEWTICRAGSRPQKRSQPASNQSVIQSLFISSPTVQFSTFSSVCPQTTMKTMDVRLLIVDNVLLRHSTGGHNSLETRRLWMRCGERRIFSFVTWRSSRGWNKIIIIISAVNHRSITGQHSRGTSPVHVCYDFFCDVFEI